MFALEQGWNKHSFHSSQLHRIQLKLSLLIK